MNPSQEKPASTPCDTQRLQLLLKDQLAGFQETELTEHLSQCETCRSALDAMAGDAPWWTEVESCFRDNAARISGNLDSTMMMSSGDFEGGESIAAEFAVNYLEPSDQPDTMGRLGEYEIHEVIGMGGMGVVLKGFHRELSRYVAVKVMAPHLGASGAARQRFVREARAAAAIVHPNVMPIHGVCTTARLPYLVMPFVSCESLQQRIDRQGALELDEILRIGSQIAAGLAAAHAQGLVHRDIKPANVLLEKGVDRVRLTDFGLARAADDGSLTRTGVVAGTPQYMSPEQAQGDALDARSDLFSLGSVLYTMATGRPPFRAETAMGILRRISDTRPRAMRSVNPQLPEWLERIVGRLHEKLPEARIATANEVALLLEHCLAHVQQPLAMPLPEMLVKPEPPAPSERTRLRRWLAGAIGIVALAVLALIAWPFIAPAPNTKPAPIGPSMPQASTDISTALDELTDHAVDDHSLQMRMELDALEQRSDWLWDELDEATTTNTESRP